MSIEKVTKRTGRVVPFDRRQIEKAIYAAARAVGNGGGKPWAETISWAVTGLLEERFGQNGRAPHVEEIQDVVEEVLIKSGHPQVAKAYILYRQKRAEARATQRMLMDTEKLVDDYLQKLDWRVNENSNMNYSLQGLNFYLASSIAARYWLHKIYPQEVQQAHSEGDMHIHDLGMLSGYCAGWDLQDLLIQGFGGVSAKVESRPPKHLRTALGQLVNFFYTLQGEVAGAVAVSNFDTLLAPFIRYDKLDYTGIKQAVQEFVYNINVPTRVGFQSLVWEELVLVRRNGRVEPVEIGQIVDEQFERNRHRVLTQGHDSFAVANADDVQALAFDADGSIRWVPVKAFVRHRVPQGSTFVRMRTSRGTAAVSQAHSMFGFEQLNGRLAIRPVAAHQVNIAHGNAKLTPTNHLVAVRHAPNSGTRGRLDLVELIDDVPRLADRARVRLADQAAAVEQIKALVQERFGGLTAFYLAYGIKDKGCWRQWAANRSLPYRVWRDLGEDEARAEFSLRNSKLWYARALEGDRLLEFLRLLGWYITEGHHSISNGLYVSQARGGDQDEMMRVLGALGALGRVEEMPGWSAQSNPTRPVLRMAGKGLLASLIAFLGGTDSTNKVIPWFVYELTHDLQEEFIATLLRGDGSEFSKYWDYTTTSKRLSLGLSLLLAMNGYKFSVYETLASRETWSDQYTLRIQKDKAAGEGYAVGDLLGRVCNRREPFAYEREYEYDLSVDTPLENFTGGSGLLCFHNTPFTNITMDLTAPSTLSNQAVVIGGQPLEATYGEFQEEMDLLNRAFAEIMLEGDARSRVFSVDYASYAPVRENGRMRLVQVGEYIDGKMATASPVRIEDNQAEVLDVRGLDIETIGIQEGQVGWHQVHYLVRHPAASMLRITTIGGFNVSVTPSHSILVLREGEIVAREAGHMEPGEYLIAPRTLDLRQESVSEISLAHELAKTDPNGIFLHGARHKDGRPLRETRTSHGKKTYAYKVSVIPLAHVVDILDELDLSAAQLGLAGSNIRIPNTIPVNEPLLEFLGYYVAEGSAEKGRYGGISLGFNLAKEQDLANRLAGWLSSAFSKALVREVPERNLVEIRAHSKLLRRIVLDVFGIVNGVERQVPPLVFGVSDGLKRAFLQGYLLGDASRKGNAFFVNTIAPGIAYGVSTLLKSLGIAHTMTEYVRDSGRRVYRVNLWDRDLAGREHHTIGKLPIAASGLTAVLEAMLEREPEYRDKMNRRYRNSLNRVMSRYGIAGRESTSVENARRIIADAEKMGVTVPQCLQSLVSADLIFLRVKTIEKQKTTTGMVYDFSTGSESFLANQILVHNTFPIPTYNVTRDFDWDNPVLEPVWTMTAKYGIPYFCLEENTAVLLGDYTPIPIKDVHASDFLVGPDGTPIMVTAIRHRKASQVVRITLKSGQTILATTTHRFPTNSGLKEAGSLSLGDQLVRSVPGRIHLGATNATINTQELEGLFDLYLVSEGLQALPVRAAELATDQPIVICPRPFPHNAPKITFKHQSNDHDTNSQTAVVPERMTPELSRLLGYLVGDGYYAKSNSAVKFVNSDEALLQDYAAIIEDLGLNYQIGQAGKSAVAKEISVHSVALRQFLLQLGLHRVTARHKVVPQVIYQCPEELAAQFLRGLFDADGSVALRPVITYTSASETLVRQVQKLLLRIGIASHFSARPRKYELTITGKNIRRFAQRIGSGHKEKRKRLEQHSVASGRKALGDPLLNTRQQVTALVAADRLPPHYRYTKTYQGYYRVPTDALKYLFPETAHVLGDYIAASSVAATEYESIVKLELVEGDFTVVDLTVDSEDHLFTLYGGILSHNSNYINSDMNPEDARSMCCRLRLDNRELRKRAGGLFAAAPLTGSAGVVTINMPRIAYQSQDEADFQERLEKLMETARTSLEIKRKMLEQLTARGLYPYSRHYLRAVEAQTGGYWSHHFSTIGLIGMNEACQNLIGAGIAHPEGQALAVRTLNFMREILKRFQLETGNLYNLEATPAEGASYRLARTDKKEFADIITAGTAQTPYYTNSTHLPVGFSDDLFAVLDHQDDLQTLYTGGTVLHIFLGERLYDWRQARKMVRTVAENYHLPYFTLTPTFSICPVHGYIAGEHKYCPHEHTEEQLARYGIEVKK